MGEQDLERIGLNELQHRCQQESELFFHRQMYDPRFCFEMFRRAFVLRSDDAWAGVYRQYHDLVLAWVSRHPLAAALDEEAEYFLNRTFEKMWSVISPQKFSDFTDLKSLLRYLRMCVHSVIVDYSRVREQAMLIEDDSEPENILFHKQKDYDSGVEKEVAGRLYARELWEQVVRRLKTEQERAIMYGMIVLNLKSREVLDTFHIIFKDIGEVYMVKENLFSRLRRDRDLLQVLSDLEEAGRGRNAVTHGREVPARGREEAPSAGKIDSRFV